MSQLQGFAYGNLVCASILRILPIEIWYVSWLQGFASPYFCSFVSGKILKDGDLHCSSPKVQCLNLEICWTNCDNTSCVWSLRLLEYRRDSTHGTWKNGLKLNSRFFSCFLTRYVVPQACRSDSVQFWEWQFRAKLGMLKEFWVPMYAHVPTRINWKRCPLGNQRSRLQEHNLEKLSF